MADKNSLGSILKRLREEKRKKQIEKDQWTKVALAKRIGVSRTAYYAWENDESLPDTEHLKRIVEVFQPNEKDELALYRAVAQLPPEKKKLPTRNRLFTGRNDYLDELHRHLQKESSVAITQAIGISGSGGIGKTQLALEYAHRHHPEVYRTVLWVDAANLTTLQTDYDAVARLLELPEREEQEAEQRVEAVKRWLDEHTRWLLIMDNADDLQLARSFMPGRLLGHIILTTRSQAIRESNITAQLVVEEMEPREALIFLLRRAGKWDEESKLDDEAKLHAIADDVRDSATELVTLLGRHPLALDQAGAYIEATGMLIADYIQLYQEEHQSLLDTRGPPRKDVDNDHSDTVTVTVHLSFKRACARYVRAADVLHFCSFLQPDAMPEELFFQDRGMQLTLRSFNDVMAALRRYSLIARDAEEKLFSMHRLVQAVLIDDIAPDVQKQWRERVVQSLNAAFPEVEFTNWWQCERLLSHTLVCAAWTKDELTQTQEVAELLTKAGVYSQERGRYSEAQGIMFRVLKFWDKQLGTTHPTTAAATHRLAQSFKKQGLYHTAEPLYRLVLKIYEHRLGIEHPAMASAMSELGTLYVLQRKYKNATLLIGLAIEIQIHRLGSTHPATLRSQNELATIFRHQGKYDTAIRIYKETLLSSEKVLGHNHPDTLRVARELGTTYLLKEEYEGVESFLTHLVDFCKQNLGEDHPDTAKSVICLAWLRYGQRKYNQSTELYLQVLASRELRSKMDPLDIARAFYGLALVLHKQRRYELAEKLYRRAMSIYEREVGGTSAYAPDLKKSYAALLRDTQRHADAAALESSDDPPYDWDKDTVDEGAAHYMALMMAARQHSQSPFGP